MVCFLTFVQRVILKLNICHDTIFPGFLGLLPVASLGVNQVGRLNLGRCVGSLQYFTVCGQQEGYQPFAVNVAREPALWMSWQQPQFSSIRPDDHHIQVRSSV